MADSKSGAGEAASTPPKVEQTPDQKTHAIIEVFHRKMHFIRAVAASQLKHAEESEKRDSKRLAEDSDALVERLKPRDRGLRVRDRTQYAAANGHRSADAFHVSPASVFG